MLEWARLGESSRQLEDAAELIRIRGQDLDREYLDRWVSVLGIETEWQRAAERAAS